MPVNNSLLTKMTSVLRLPVYGVSPIFMVALIILIIGGKEELHRRWPVLLAILCYLFVVLLILAIIDRHISENNDVSNKDSER